MQVVYKQLKGMYDQVQLELVLIGVKNKDA
jgi:hypothetical protein